MTKTAWLTKSRILFHHLSSLASLDTSLPNTPVSDILPLWVALWHSGKNAAYHASVLCCLSASLDLDCSDFSPVLLTSLGKQNTAQVRGPLPPHIGDSMMDSPAADSAWPNPGHCWGSEAEAERNVCWSLPLSVTCLSNKSKRHLEKKNLIILKQPSLFCSWAI